MPGDYSGFPQLGRFLVWSWQTFCKNLSTRSGVIHQLELVLERLGRNPGILPVVSRSEANHILGVNATLSNHLIHKCLP